MPIYEYHCGKCGDFEIMQRMSDKPLTTCPTCRKKVTKLISSTTFHLKGSGWYITDYARKGDGKSAKSDKSDKKADASDAGSAATDTAASDAGTSESSAKTAKSSESKSSGKASKKSEKAAVA